MQPPAPASFSNYGDFATIKTDMTTKEMIEVMQASLEGKPIQAKDIMGREWEDIRNPTWDWGFCNYRVKPEPKYRPFKSAEEVLEAIKEKGDLLKDKECAFHTRICAFNDKNIWTGGATEGLPMSEAYNDYIFTDGTPFGKLED